MIQYETTSFVLQYDKKRQNITRKHILGMAEIYKFELLQRSYRPNNRLVPNTTGTFLPLFQK